MKYTQRLDYGRLAEVLHERGLAGLDSIRELLQLSQDGGMPFCEALVTSNLVSDWELSKVVCETFQLPFLPVDLVNPNQAVLEEVDAELFQKHQIVPVDMFGQVLTVAMPALVPAEVLAQVAAMTDFVVLPMVGTVESNRRWISEHMSVGAGPELEGGWESMFDAADAEVNAGQADGAAPAAEELLTPVLDESTGDENVEIAVDDALDLGSLDLGTIEAMPSDDLEVDPIQSVDANEGAGPSELPPMPEFGQDQREAG